MGALVAEYVDKLLGSILVLVLVFSIVILRRLSVMAGVGFLLPYMFAVSGQNSTNLSLVDVLLPILVVSSLILLARRGSGVNILVPISLFLPLLIWLPLSYLLAEANPLFVFETGRFVVEFLKLVACAVLFATVYYLSSRDIRAGRLELFDSWIATALVMATISFLAYIAGSADSSRYTGTFENPNHLGLYLVTSYGIVVLKAAHSGNRHTLLNLSILALGVLATGSRGPLLGTMVLVLLLPLLPGFVSASRRLGLIAFALLSLGIAYVVRDSIPAVSRAWTADGEVNTGLRSLLWSGAYELWALRPLTGVGLGQFAGVSPNFTGIPIFLVVHNTYLTFLVEAGLIGAVLFLVIILSPLYYFSTSKSGGLGFGVWLVAFAPVLTNMFTLNAENARYLWAFLAIALALSAGQRQRERSAIETVPSRELSTDSVN